MTPVCPKCKHLMPPGEEHACETAAERAARERLISEAAEAGVTEEDEAEVLAARAALTGPPG